MRMFQTRTIVTTTEALTTQAAYREPGEVSFMRIQLLPMVSQRDDWC